MLRAVVIVIVSLATLLNAADGFQLFSGSGSAGVSNSSSNSSSGANYRSVQLYVRKVDERHPYYRTFSFRVPLELNYALPIGQLFNKFSMALQHHCNTTNITRVVLNNLIVIESDLDVWRLKKNGRIEVWSANSGQPTRAKTVAAFAKGMLRRDMALTNHGCSIGECRRKDRRGGRRGGSRRRGSRRERGREEEEEEQMEQAIVVPDFDNDGEMDPEYEP